MYVYFIIFVLFSDLKPTAGALEIAGSVIFADSFLVSFWVHLYPKWNTQTWTCLVSQDRISHSEFSSHGRHSGKFSIPVSRTGLFKSSLAYSGSVLWTLLDCYPALKRLNHVTCHTLCADWLALHVIFGDCYPPETFYHIVSPIYHAFTHLICATDDFIAPCIHFHFCLSHIMFDVWTSFIPCVYWCVVD